MECMGKERVRRTCGCSWPVEFHHADDFKTKYISKKKLKRWMENQAIEERKMAGDWRLKAEERNLR